MNVTINGIPTEYISDFPKGWEHKFGDHFKYPVLLGGENLFIKRFENKPLAYDMLMALRTGAYAGGMPILYAFGYCEEEQAYYLFQEYIQGTVIEDKLKGIFVFSLQDYAANIFDALNYLHDQGFWHTDFNLENIMVDRERNFYLIDIDSCLPLTVTASNKTIKDASFSGGVFFNLKRVEPSFEFGDVDGRQLNLLQLIFSIIHFYNFTKNREKKSYASFLMKGTANALGTLVPFFDGILRKALTDGIGFEEVQRVVDYIIEDEFGRVALSNQPPDPAGQFALINKSSELEHDENKGGQPVKNKVDKDDPVEQVGAIAKIKQSVPEPIIQSLEINGQALAKISLKRGEEYMLSWRVLNASHVELDGNIIAIGSRTRDLLAEHSLIHQLVAINQASDPVKRSAPRSIQIKVEGQVHELQPPKPKPQLGHFKVNGRYPELKVPYGNRAIVSWNVKHVKSVKINGEPRPPSGEFVRSIRKTQTFSLKGGNIEKKIKVLVYKRGRMYPEIINFLVNGQDASSINVKFGEIINLSWSTKQSDEIALYKNGTKIPLSHQALKNRFLSVEEKNTDDTPYAIQFKLIAISKDNQKVESVRNVWMLPKDRKKITLILLGTLIILAALILFFIILKNYS